MASRAIATARWSDVKLKLPGQSEPRLLGRGVTSKVYEGEWLQTPVAVKIIHSVVDTQALVRELEIVRSWGKHDCICYSFAVCDDVPRREGDIAILTEYAQLGDLQQYIESFSSAGQQLPLSHIVRISLDMADAMKFCHARGLVHRSLKPQNVLIFEGGRAKVTDLIRAKHAKSGGADDAGNNHSTVQYSAPECLEGEESSGRILDSADVYSFGCILWEMVTRQRPWSNKTSTQIILAYFRQESLPLPALSPSCTPSVQNLLSCCLIKDPMQRPRFDMIHNELMGMLHSDGLVISRNSSGAVDGGVGVNTFPQWFCCPLSMQLMNEPVVLADGHSYERVVLEQWLMGSDMSPVTQERLHTKMTFPNHALKRAILDWAGRQNSLSSSQMPAFRTSPPPPGYMGKQSGSSGGNGTFASDFSLALQHPSSVQQHSGFLSVPIQQDHSMFGNSGMGQSSQLQRSADSIPGFAQSHSTFAMHQGANPLSGSLGSLSGGLGGLGDGLNKWDHDYDLPPTAASSLLMNLVPGAGSGGGAVGTGSVSGAAVGTRGGSAWDALGGTTSMLFSSSSAPAGAHLAIPGEPRRSSASTTLSYSPTSTKSDELEEGTSSGGGSFRERAPLGPMRVFPNVAAAAAVLTPEEAGKALKALFAKGSGGEAAGYCDVRALRRSLAVWENQEETLNWRDPLDNGTTCLHEAVMLNQREAVKLLLVTPGVHVNVQDFAGVTPLRLAAASASTTVVRLLLEQPGIDVNLAASDGSSPLSACKTSPKFNEIKRLLRKAGATLPGEVPGSWAASQPRAPDHIRQEILSCVNRRDVAGLTALAQQWENAPDVFNEPDPRDRGNTPLLIAASDRGGAGILACLLTLPFIDVNKSNMAGEIALHLCCRHNNMDTLRRLLATQECDLNRQDITQGRTPIMAAIKMGHKDIVKLLCAQPELDLSVIDKKGLNALALASRQPEIKEFLSREMAKAAAAASASFAVPVAPSTPASAVAGAELADAATALLSGDWRLVGQCLIFAAKCGDLAAVTKLQEEWVESADAWNFPDPGHNNFTPLHFAVLHDHPKIVKALISNQLVDINRVDTENMSPAHIAVLEDRRECLKMLLTHDALDLRRRDRNTDTPLSMCARHDRRNCAKLILGHHSTRRFINGTNPGGLTTLNIACFNGFVEIVKLLLGSPDIDVNKPNKKNSTPLIEAVRKGKVEIVRLLLKHPRIDLEHRCSFGGDALASSVRFPDVKALLLEAYRERGITPVIPNPDENQRALTDREGATP